MRSLYLTVIKIPKVFDVVPYLYLFNESTIHKVNGCKCTQSKIITFTSELVKRYYLAVLLRVRPEDVNLSYNQNGKPELVNSNIYFNISHCDDYLVIVISNGYKCGIDIEFMNKRYNICLLKQKIFSTSEKTLVAKSRENFIKLWVKKEALIKMLGLGFAFSTIKSTAFTLADYDVGESEFVSFQIYTQLIFDKYWIAVCIGK